MQWLRRFIAQNPAKVFRDEPGAMINMRCKTMKRKVKFFDKLYDIDTLDEKNKRMDRKLRQEIDRRETNRCLGRRKRLRSVHCHGDLHG